MNEKTLKKPSFGISVVIIAFLFVVIIAQLVLGYSPEIHLTLVFSIAFAVILLMATGTKWAQIEEGILHGCKIATVPMLILMFIGLLIPMLIACGTIPSLIYYGLKIISPSVFLVTACVVCSVSAICIGSSWTTAATFGVAFMGISVGLGIPAPITAGAVISGAVLGDKLSPMSDSTNLAAGVCEANLFDHVRAMVYTTVPAYVISLVLYAIIGSKYSASNMDMESVNEILGAIEANFDIDALHVIISLLPLVLIVVLAAKQVSALAIMVVGSLFAMLIAVITQGYNLYDLMVYMNNGFSMETGSDIVDSLVNRGGIQSMMWTLSLGYLGLSYGGILEKCLVMEAILDKMERLTRTPRGLVITHNITSVVVNFLSGSQYVAIIIPGRMYLPAYDKLNLQRRLASRTCEDSGTVTSQLVPWGLCGVFYLGALGVSAWDYAPYTFLCYLTPIIAILCTCFKMFLWEKIPEEAAAVAKENEANA